MTFKVNLVIEGVDILSDDFDESPAAEFQDVQWQSVAGVTLACLYTEGDPVADACTFTRRLEYADAGRVTRVFDELVNLSEIAHRLDVTRQTVRFWAEGTRGPGDFPIPDHAHGQHGSKGPMKVWRWADVNCWLANLGLDDGLDYLTRRQVIEVDSHIQRLPEPVGSAWTQTSKKLDDSSLISHLQEAIALSLAAIDDRERDVDLVADLMFSSGHDICVISTGQNARRGASKDSKYHVVGSTSAIAKAYD